MEKAHDPTFESTRSPRKLPVMDSTRCSFAMGWWSVIAGRHRLEDGGRILVISLRFCGSVWPSSYSKPSLRFQVDETTMKSDLNVGPTAPLLSRRRQNGAVRILLQYLWSVQDAKHLELSFFPIVVDQVSSNPVRTVSGLSDFVCCDWCF